MRKALIVGINHYSDSSSLFGCVDDAYSVKTVLEKHGDGTRNFDVRLMTGTGPANPVRRADLKDAVSELFADEPDIALFYFAGHGHIDATGGYILASDAKRGDEGVSLADVMTLASKSKAKNKIVILDSCHSGIAGTPPNAGPAAVLTEGMTVLTASTAEQYATEANGRGVFSWLLVDALGGAGCNLLGAIGPAAVYAHVDQSLGAWHQRPMFKTNVRNFVSLRDVQPPIPRADLMRISEFFPPDVNEYQLDPTYEPEERGRTPETPPPDPLNVQKFAVLQKYNRVNLVVPVGAPHMWHAAMESKSCKLTVLGEHYRRIVVDGRI